MARLFMPSYDDLSTFGRNRGSGSALPSTDLRRGDVYQHTTNGLMVYNGSAWQRMIGDRTLGDSYLAALTASGIAAAPAWTDLATVTATAAGIPVTVRWQATLWNGSSGADRTASLQLVCDSTVIFGWTNMPITLANLPRTTKVAANTHTPAAGSHTWKVQANGSVAAAVIAESAALTVVELG